MIIRSRKKPISENRRIPLVFYGSKPADGGWLSNISWEDAQKIREHSPLAARYLRSLIGAKELLHSAPNTFERYCLWLEEAKPEDIKNCAEIRERVRRVKELRMKSGSSASKMSSLRPTLFESTRQPTGPYLAIPRVSSEHREYLPTAVLPSEVIATHALFTISNPTLEVFGWLSSQPFMLWHQTISGRLENRLRFAADVTYNCFPFPDPDTTTLKRLEAAAQKILSAREQHPHSSLAALYDPLAMLPALRKAHMELDRQCLRALGLPATASEETILARLFHLYQRLAENNPGQLHY